MLENETNAVNLLNQQVKSHTFDTPSTPTRIDPNLMPPQTQVITKNRHMELVKKCCKTPLLYFTVIPLIVLLIFLLVKPSYIYDVDKETKKRKINTTRLFGSLIGIIAGIDLFIYYYLIKECKYNI